MTIPQCLQTRSARAVLTAAVAIAPLPAAADDVLMSGTVLGTCAFAANTAGVLGQNPSATELSSQRGSRGQITATTTGSGFELTIAGPTDWTTSPGSTPSTSFAIDHQVSGATSDTGSGNSSVALGNGTSTVSLGMVASADSGAFQAGTHVAAITVTCEATGGS